MKKLLLSLAGLLLLSSALMAQNKSKKGSKVAKAAVAAIDTNEITWVSIDEVQELMKKNPKKVYVDVYTSWCGWCKVMDKKTFTNKNVIKYINTNFYAVKLDAEQKDSIHFMGGHYGLEGRTNQFAVQLLRGQLSYPTTVIMEENFQNPQIIPGYQEVKNIEPILKYLAQNVYKTTPWEEYMKNFKPSWE
jgi:thioredoxin-related protein